MTTNVTFTGTGKAVFMGLNGSGSISIPGLKVGDIILNTYSLDGLGNWDYSPPGSLFETSISVVDQLQQSYTGNASTVNFTIIFFRGP